MSFPLSKPTAKAVAGSTSIDSRRRFLRLGVGLTSVAAGSAMLVACGGGGEAADARESAQSEATACGTMTWDLQVGKDATVVGTVSAKNDGTTLFVTYTLTDPNCTFGTLHLWAGNDLANLPMSPAPQNNPQPGQFPYHYDTNGGTSYTFAIALSELGIADLTKACNDKSMLKLYVVTHAEVSCKNADGTVSHDTAFGGPVKVDDGGRWWWYAEYNLCCTVMPDLGSCQTAFAYGTHVFTTDSRSNPQRLPTLGLIKNRWGWAIQLPTSVIGTSKSYTIYAGAGLNDVTKGSVAGALTVVWDGTTATVTYTTSNGYWLDALHLYAGDDAPTTVAPGQYGHIGYSEDGAHPTTYSFTVDLADANKDGFVWLIAHAVVCK